VRAKGEDWGVEGRRPFSLMYGKLLLLQ